MPAMGNFTLWNAVLLAIVLTVGLVCVGCIWHALQNLKIEKSVYDALQKEDKLQVLYERYRRGEVKGPDALIVPDFYSAVVEQARQYGVGALDSSGAVQRYLGVLYGEAISPKIHSGYVSDRMYAVLCSVDTDNMVKKLPALEDLRELTMQRERGGLSTSGFRLLAPGILVCGILGTLIGVHSCLGEEMQIDRLADALLPGALAVGITVMVMCFRGWYNSRWAQFVSAFDEYTLRHMLPLFRPAASQVESDIGTLADALSKTQAQYTQIERLRGDLQDFRKQIGACHSACAELLAASGSRLAAACSDYKQRYNQAFLLQEVQKKWVEAVDLLQVGYKELLERVLEVQKDVLSTDKRHSLLRVFEEVIPPARDAIALMYDIKVSEELTQVKQVVAESGALMAPVDENTLKTEEGHMKNMAEWMAHLADGCRKFEEAGQRITQIDDEIDEEIVRHLNPTVKSDLPAVIEQLKQNYEIARTAAVPRQSAFVSFARQQKSEMHTLRLDKDKEVKKCLDASQGVSHYPSGWAGVKLRVRDWRLAERDKWQHHRRIGWLTWLVILAALGVFVVWPAWLIYRAEQEKAEAQDYDIERYSYE